MVKAIFFDIDGTLVSFKTHKIASSSIEAINELRSKGIKVFVATGRPLMAITNLGDLEFDGYITVNGGYCINGKNEVIYQKSIPSDDIRSLISYQKKYETFPCIFVHPQEMFLNFVNEDVLKVLELVDFPELPVKDMEYAAKNEVFQIMAFFDKEMEDEIFSKVLINCKPARWNPLFTDIISRENSKHTGIEKIIEYYNIDVSETMAFGDGGNDISMLKYAATGVAMGNARDEVKKCADYVTDNVDEDGVWNALKHFKII